MRFLSNLLLPFLDWIQVEVTSHCNAECRILPSQLCTSNPGKTAIYPLRHSRSYCRHFDERASYICKAGASRSYTLGSLKWFAMQGSGVPGGNDNKRHAVHGSDGRPNGP